MGARDLLAELADAGLSVRAEGERLVIRPASKLTVAMRSALVEAKPELLALLAPKRPYRLTKSEGDAAHAEPWDDAAIARFVARVGLFLRRGIDAADADDLAERLHFRDVEVDERRICLECRHLSGRAGAWRCGGATQRRWCDLPAELVTQPQRCAGFAVSHSFPLCETPLLQRRAGSAR